MMEGGRASDRFVAGAVLGGKYVLRERIGAGGVGEVWSALNKTTRGIVALKLVAPSSSSRDNVLRFRHEASLSASLTHRNIVRVFDLIEEPDGTLALVMEYLRGENARDRLLRTGRLPTSSAVSIATQILSALTHAHAHGIVHRDIKPPNIFLATEPDGGITPKLLDFGIAKTAVSSLHTSHGQLLGTPRYMSPEQIRCEAIDGRSDVFAVAVVLYELLTGRSPFAAGFATASLAAVLETPVAPDPLISDALWSVLDRALTKDREERYASADEFASALRDAIERRQGSLASVLVRSKPPPPIALDIPGLGSEATSDEANGDNAAEARRRRAKRAVIGVVGAALVVGLLAGIRKMTTHDEAPIAPAPRAVVAVAAAQPIPPALPPVDVPPMITPEREAALPSTPAARPSAVRARLDAAKPAKASASGSAAPSANRQSSERIVKDPGF